MITPTQRRYSRWYEVILLNNLFLFLLGYLVVVFYLATFIGVLSYFSGRW